MASIIRRAAHVAKSKYLDIITISKLKQLAQPQKKTDRKIKVVFIVQLLEIWDKQCDIFEEMRRRSDIDVKLLVVPKFDFVKKQIVNDYTDNYFLKTYPQEAVRALDENGKCLDVRTLHPDYLFYPRPYDHYLPFELRGPQMVGDVKCCYVPYGYLLSDSFIHECTDKAFFRNMYLAFLESDAILKIMKQKNAATVKKGLQHFVNYGYPSLAPFCKIQPRDEIKTVLWTPRWSYDARIGGSHFFEYKDTFLKLSEKYPDVRFMFRPHPLMFEEFVHGGRMTQEEVDIFLKQLEERGVYYDKGTMLQETAKQVDLLITDFSSIVISMFCTRKPIVYCNSQIPMNIISEEMKNAMYNVDNEQQLEENVSALLEGKDVLKEKRFEIVANEEKMHLHAAEKIVNAIAEDFINTHRL